jgi:hypothetical protein
VAAALLAAGGTPRPDSRVRSGQILYVATPTTVRTRGAGNLSVDLPRGRALLVADVVGETLVLSPSSADADLLRAFGVRRIPRYTAALTRVGIDFLDPPAWARLRDQAVGRLRERWPALSAAEAERIFQGEPFIGMSLDQAGEAVGSLAISREPQDSSDGPVETWRIGRRPRAAELRLYTEGRERGVGAKTFEQYLAGKTRAILRFRAGILVAIEPPSVPP